MSGPVVMSRAEAKAVGLKRYFTGLPCVRGHVSECNVSNALCLACGREMKKAKLAASPEEVRAAARAYYATHKEQRLAHNREWRVANPEKHHASDRAKLAADPEGARTAARAKRALKGEHIRAVDRARYATNPAKKASTYAWQAANREKVLASQRNVRAARKGAGGKHTPSDINTIFKLQRGKCAYCKTSIKRKKNIDHIKPLSKGGSNYPRNIQLLCPPCNLSKQAADPVAFAQRIGLLI